MDLTFCNLGWSYVTQQCMCLINLVGEHLYGMTPIEAWTRKPSNSNHGVWFPSFCVHPKGLKHETSSSNNENKIEQEITTKMVIIVKQTMNDEMAIWFESSGIMTWHRGTMWQSC
jgi:hypothetical protein